MLDMLKAIIKPLSVIGAFIVLAHILPAVVLEVVVALSLVSLVGRVGCAIVRKATTLVG